jgi:hypothetical protein
MQTKHQFNNQKKQKQANCFSTFACTIKKQKSQNLNQSNDNIACFIKAIASLNSSSLITKGGANLMIC